MSSLIIYLLKVSAGSAIIYVFYQLFFRNETFYRRNRIILLSSMLIPAVLPLIIIQAGTISGSMQPSSYFIEKYVSSGVIINESISNEVSTLNIDELLFWIWISVALVMIFRFMAGILRTVMIIKRCEHVNYDSDRIFISDAGHPPFSFWRSIVIPRKIYCSGSFNEVLLHERAHVSQYHTIDLLLSEIFISITWFSPFSWLIRRALALNHEYIADKAAVGESENSWGYQYLLMNVPPLFRKAPLANNFSNNIKNRIVMINRKPTGNYAAIKNLIILPAVLLLLLLVSFKSSNSIIEPQEKQTLFTLESLDRMNRFIQTNIIYPDDARKNGVEGRFYVIVRISKGGRETVITINEKDQSINVPLISFNEFVVAGYRSSGSAETGPAAGQADLTPLKDEGKRVAGMLHSLDLPEWKDKNMLFAFSINFQLKTPPGSSSIVIKDTGFVPGTNPMIIVDGIEKPYSALKTIEPSEIASMSVLKDGSAVRKYGERAKNGVIEITLK